MKDLAGLALRSGDTRSEMSLNTPDVELPEVELPEIELPEIELPEIEVALWSVNADTPSSTPDPPPRRAKVEGSFSVDVTDGLAASARNGSSPEVMLLLPGTDGLVSRSPVFRLFSTVTWEKWIPPPTHFVSGRYWWWSRGRQRSRDDVGKAKGVESTTPREPCVVGVLRG